LDTSTLHKDLKNLFSDLSIDDPRLQVAEKAAFLTMAHFIDLPDAQDSGSQAITSGTPNYDLTLSGTNQVDRITSAVFVASSVKQPLEDWNIRQYQYAYRGLAETGTPSAFCYYNDQLWLYKIPNLSGTVYFTCQHVLTDLTDFPDNYYPLMVALVEMHIYRPTTPEGAAMYDRAYRKAKDLIKSFKGRMHPLKTEMEKTTYRTNRIEDLNTLI